FHVTGVQTCALPIFPPTAIFTDGWRFHASPSVNRLADDARKRQVLRDAGFQVLAFTWDDLQPAGEGSVVDVPWLRPEAPGAVLADRKSVAQGKSGER